MRHTYTEILYDKQKRLAHIDLVANYALVCTHAYVYDDEDKLDTFWHVYRAFKPGVTEEPKVIKVTAALHTKMLLAASNNNILVNQHNEFLPENHIVSISKMMDNAPVLPLELPEMDKPRRIRLRGSQAPTELADEPVELQPIAIEGQTAIHAKFNEEVTPEESISIHPSEPLPPIMKQMLQERLLHAIPRQPNYELNPLPWYVPYKKWFQKRKRKAKLDKWMRGFSWAITELMLGNQSTDSVYAYIYPSTDYDEFEDGAMSALSLFSYMGFGDLPDGIEGGGNYA